MTEAVNEPESDKLTLFIVPSTQLYVPDSNLHMRKTTKKQNQMEKCINLVL